MIAAIVLTSIQVLPARSQITRSQITRSQINSLFTPYGSEQFFEAGEQQLEQEIKLLQIPRTASDQLLQLERKDITFQVDFAPDPREKIPTLFAGDR